MGRLSRTLVAGCVCALGQLAWAESTVQLDPPLPASLAVVSKRSTVGSSIGRARIEARTVPDATMKQMLGSAIAEGLKDCGRDDAYRVSFEALEMRDHIGETNSHLSGMGLYVSLPDPGVSQQGTYYLAPFAAMRVKVALAGKEAATVDVEDFQKILLDRDPGRSSEFLDLDGEQVAKIIAPFVKEAVAGKLRNAACPSRGSAG